MKKTIVTALTVVIVLGIFCMVFSKVHFDVSTSVREYQHEEKSQADSSIGETTIAKDGTIDPESFVSHLPLVVIDTNGEEIPYIYEFNDDMSDKFYKDENITNPWLGMTISVIENDNYVNTVMDSPSLKTNGLIKIRGASSSTFEKKQYGIKLLDENEQESELSVLGMEADEDWVLSNSILDSSCIRNYMAYNIGGQIFPYTPEAKFCEVIMKDGDTYNYCGLYLLTETVKKAEGRVNIADFDANENQLSYIICRDRRNQTKTTMSTWASDSQLCYGWFTFQYPKEELLTDDVVHRVEEQLSTIEKVLYSEDYEEFLTYPKYIDVDSFVDYFVVNEFFMNYDSGNNSTYYYQDHAHKLSMGPLWDYDNCWDNYSMEAGDAEYIVFILRPWFEKLVQDPAFVEQVCERYAELRETILSTEYIESFIDDTVSYLGNAIKRDRSRWRAVYEEEHMLHVVEEGQGYVIDRNRETHEEEIIRLKDMMTRHGEWLDEYMDDFLSEYVVEVEQGKDVQTTSAAALIFVVGFMVMIVLINRKTRGM
ncbi:MAG: CotH kinase family protein [Lachnospiraceae bacterium]|nr:CotH kinase family protein [Lachnospiraceae bacterium]